MVKMVRKVVMGQVLKENVIKVKVKLICKDEGGKCENESEGEGGEIQVTVVY